MATAPVLAAQPHLVGRDFLRLADVSGGEVLQLVHLAHQMKQRRWATRLEPLAGMTVALIFEKPSTRTRVSFAVAVQQLGGLPLELAPNTLQLARAETLADTGRVLSRYVDAIVLRTGDQSVLEELAEAASIPVVNALSNQYHPCQTLADLLTLSEQFGGVKGFPVAYVGDGSNMAAAWLEAAALVGLDLRVATPAGYAPDAALAAWASAAARQVGGSVVLTEDPGAAVDGARAVYTDVWVSMGQEAEATARRQAFTGFQVTPALMQSAAPDAVFMHCLPAHRGEEVAAAVLDGPQSVVWEQAENRLHTEKALLASLLTPDFSLLECR
ncbi:MAG: ornithine carbamoyltransferase [Thermaerobacter sp.]|nr:ornithine carbamoyltransferase [Thermaerobacter sp.]